MSALKHILRWFLYAVGGVLVLLLLLAGVTQTQMFREYLRSVAVEQLDSLFTADVQVGELTGNLVTGFSLRGITISLRGDTIVHASQINIRYDILSLPGKSIAVHDVILYHPVINLIRSRNGRWNIDEMLAPSGDDTSAGAFDWPVTVRRLELRDGSFSLRDSVSLAAGDADGGEDRAPDALHYDRLDVRDLNIVLSARLRGPEYHASISRLACTVAGTPIRIRHLAGDFLVTPSQARVQDLRVITDSTRFVLNAEMSDFNLLDGFELEQLRNVPTTLSLSIDRFSFCELGCFLPATDFLKGTVDGDLRASGPFGSLFVDPLDLRFGSSRLVLRGGVLNLHDPGNLTLDVEIAESQIDPADPLALMPSFDLPDFRSIGPVALSGSYKGTPLDFNVRLAAQSAAGTFRTEGFTLRIGGPQTLQYDGSVSFNGIDLARVFNQEDLRSNLNGMVAVRGEGVRPARMSAQTSASFDSSTFRRLPLGNARMHVAVRNKKVSGNLGLSLGQAVVQLEGTLDSVSNARPPFSLRGIIESLNLAEVLDDTLYDSQLNCRVQADGAGISLATIGGEINMDFESSRYRDYSLADSRLKFAVSQEDTAHKRIAVTTPFIEASLEGAFDLDYLRALLVFEVQNAILSIRERVAPFDSTLRATTDTTAFHEVRQYLIRNPDMLSCHYQATVKDVRLLSLIFGTREFNGSGTVDGRLEGNYARLASSTRLNVKEFYYGDADSGMLIEEGECFIETNDLTPDRSFAKANVRVQAGVRILDISRTELDSVRLDLRIDDRSANFAGRGALNRHLRWNVKGNAVLQGDSILCRFGSMTAAYDEYDWIADSGMTLHVTGNAIRLQRVVLRRGDAEIEGRCAVRRGGEIVGSARAFGVSLNDLRYFLAREKNGTAEEQAFGGIADATMVLGGTIEHPQFNVTLRADSIAIRDTPFGTVNGRAVYNDGLLTLDVDAGDPNRLLAGTPEFAIRGTLSVPRATAGGASEQEMDLTVRGDGALINILDPLLPNFNQLTGKLDCDLRILGTASHPRYVGSLALNECGFLFESNNMYYITSGRFAAEGDRIRVVEATMRNIPADERGGRTGLVNITGDFALRGLTPGDFRLDATGQLNVVKESTRRSSLSVYGDLFVIIGRKGLHFTGEIDNSLLRGDLVIQNSSLIFPPTSEVAEEKSDFSVPIVIYDDTSHFTEQSSITAAEKYYGSKELHGPGRRPVEELRGAKSFLDGLRYDLDIEASGSSTEIRMVFNPLLNEELVATIDGRLSITEDGRRWQGDLAVSRAYYNFYRRFEADGSIRFAGDFMNPILDITATYRGSRTVQDSLIGNKDENILVTVNITGPRTEPKLNMSMEIDDVDYYAYQGRMKSNDVQSDAIGFIIYGTFPLSTAQKGEVSSEMTPTLRRSLLTGASSLLTGTLSEFLRRQTGFINSVELNFNRASGIGESADIRLSGSLWSGYWKYGGQILEKPLENANFSLLYSFGSIFDSPTLRNLMIEVESKMERGMFGSATDLRRTNSARVFYRFSF